MPKGPQGQKRPADAVSAAIMVGRVATGEIEEVRIPSSKRGAAGGRARADRLSPVERGEVASKAARARWGSNEIGLEAMTHTAKNETGAVRGRQAVCMYPNNGLGQQKKEFSEAFSGFEMLRDRFKK